MRDGGEFGGQAGLVGECGQQVLDRVEQFITVHYYPIPHGPTGPPALTTYQGAP
ncbi:MAG: hypothetical protein JWN00_1652 [Actinomycetia bacterium]|nr:hypothetical protein [Actinomycetes bacterium]